MAIKRRWTPPSIPLRNSLPAWKAICEDIHLNLLLMGWGQTSDAGQLDFADVTVLPPDGTFAGYRMYLLNDPLKDVFPIYMRLDFGCGSEGLGTSTSTHRSRTLRILSRFGVSTDSSGQLIGGVISAQHPQAGHHSAAAGTSQNETAGVSVFTSNDYHGFYGFAYGVGSRNNPFQSSSGSYYGASLAFFIQRDLSAEGEPQGTGFSVVLPDLKNLNNAYTWLFTGMEPAVMHRFSSSGVSSSVNNARRVGDLRTSQSFGGEVAFQPVFVTQPQLRRCPALLSYFHLDVEEGTILPMPVAQGQNKDFICLGNRFGMPVDSDNNEWGAWAMLFEGDDVSP